MVCPILFYVIFYGAIFVTYLIPYFLAIFVGDGLIFLQLKGSYFFTQLGGQVFTNYFITCPQSFTLILLFYGNIS